MKSILLLPFSAIECNCAICIGGIQKEIAAICEDRMSVYLLGRNNENTTRTLIRDLTNKVFEL